MVIGPHAAASMLITTCLEHFYIKSSYKNKIVWLTAVATLSFVSHFLLDSVPHRDYALDLNDSESVSKLAADIISAGLALLLIFWPRIRKLAEPLQHPKYDPTSIPPEERSLYAGFFLIVCLGVFFACLPDIINHMPLLSSNIFLTNFTKFHDLLHVSKKLDVWMGYYVQVVIYLVMIFSARYLAQKNTLERMAIIVGEEFELRF